MTIEIPDQRDVQNWLIRNSNIERPSVYNVERWVDYNVASRDKNDVISPRTLNQNTIKS